ncbi:hypothetical protein CPSG_04549 [Coccidioides posadasii str. Silveira]|uniref:Uncharacterized protein n=1 Tax=Coccidioides posadasii (strain RMSCC 757 / Silveira) TaxID=443226 RepID=E9D308_COCPS|nr:hypothetical protein CPSG_04549 [Coccidioides posadasii str. Silveira]
MSTRYRVHFIPISRSRLRPQNGTGFSYRNPLLAHLFRNSEVYHKAYPALHNFFLVVVQLVHPTSLERAARTRDRMLWGIPNTPSLRITIAMLCGFAGRIFRNPQGKIRCPPVCSLCYWQLSCTVSMALDLPPEAEY